MSTITLNYPEVIQVRRLSGIGRILILSALALVGITILLTMMPAKADLSHQAAVSQDSIVTVPVPVPTPPGTEIQPVPSGTPSPASGLAGELSVLPVPVPTPPAQSE